jgi:hypothetical protein
MSANDFGRKFLVENCQTIKLADFLKKYRKTLKELVIGSELDAMGIKIEIVTSKTGYGGTRCWFKCPLCGARIGVLLRHPITTALGCRKCLNLDYKKRRYKGMIEATIQ